MEKESKKEQIEQKQEKKTDKQLYWVLGVMLGLVLLFLAASAIFKSLNTFEYFGLTFTKEKFGDIPLYKYYYFTNPSYTTGAVTGQPQLVTILLRNDPRENNILVDGEIEFKRGKTVYISINGAGITQCPYSSIAMHNLNAFLSENGFSVTGGVSNKEEAEQNKLKYLTCEEKPDNPVILFQSGNETKIERIGFEKTIINTYDGIEEVVEKKLCYKVTVNNCEILEATEKLIVQSILDARAR